MKGLSYCCLILIVVCGCLMPATVFAQKADTAIYDIADVMPHFPGGDTALLRFIANNTNYPKAVADSDIAGKVYVQIVVERDGSISNTKVVKSVHPLLDAEALKVVARMPKWEAGIKANKHVRLHVAIPFEFNIHFASPKAVGTVWSDTVDAEFPGGRDELARWIVRNLKYPEQAINSGDDGFVYVQFMIDTGGNVTKASVIFPKNKLLDAEALRVVNNMPKWQPATVNGQKVPIGETLPLHFHLLDPGPFVEPLRLDDEVEAITQLLVRDQPGLALDKAMDLVKSHPKNAQAYSARVSVYIYQKNYSAACDDLYKIKDMGNTYAVKYILQYCNIRR